MMTRVLALLVTLALASGCSGLRGLSEFQEAVVLEFARGRGRIIDPGQLPTEPVVQLCARHSYMARVAIHPWFLAFDPATGLWEEWEIWGFGEPTHFEKITQIVIPAEVFGEVRQVPRKHASYGYIDYQQLLTRGDPETVLGEWKGPDARAILDVLQDPDRYPYREQYRAWPGPNSNTYVSWVLREAGVPVDLHPQAIGKDYVGPYGIGIGTSPSRTGLQLETPLLGAKVGLTDGVELHFLCMTFGIDLWPPALKTPLGRFGVPE